MFVQYSLKKKNRNKKILKNCKYLPDVGGMAAWVEALADKYIYTKRDQSEICTLWNDVLSAGDHIPQHCYI